MADSRLSDLPSGAAISDSDEFYANQSNQSVSVTGAQLKAQEKPAQNISYDNTISGLAATDAKAAIDELAASVGGGGGGSGFDPTTSSVLFEDFLGHSFNGLYYKDWIGLEGGAASDVSLNVNLAGDQNHSGVVQLMTQYVADSCFMTTGIYDFDLEDNNIVYTTRIRVSHVPTAVDRSSLFVGLHSGVSFGGILHTTPDAAGFIIDHTANAANIVAISNGAVNTNSIDTGVAVVADTWYTLSFVRNATTGETEFFVNNVSVGTISGAGNSPAEKAAAFMSNHRLESAFIQKYLYVDYVNIRQTMDRTI